MARGLFVKKTMILMMIYIFESILLLHGNVVPLRLKKVKIKNNTIMERRSLRFKNNTIMERRSLCF